MPGIELRSVEANGLRFSVLEAGAGPLVLLLHGFPDSAWTWEHQIPRLADAGYRVAAPFLRGHPPTEIPADGGYDPDTLVRDAVGLIRTLSEAPAYVVGHDLGALLTHWLMAHSPSLVRRSAVIVVGHPGTFAKALELPAVLDHLAHMWFFQLQELAAVAVRANDMAFLDHLWAHLSPGHSDHEHIARVKRETLGLPGALEAALAYYPNLVGRAPMSARISNGLAEPCQVPTLAIYGRGDPTLPVSEDEAGLFAAPYRREVVDGAAHWVHRERPDEVSDLLLSWLDGGRS